MGERKNVETVFDAVLIINRNHSYLDTYKYKVTFLITNVGVDAGKVCFLSSNHTKCCEIPSEN